MSLLLYKKEQRLKCDHMPDPDDEKPIICIIFLRHACISEATSEGNHLNLGNFTKAWKLTPSSSHCISLLLLRNALLEYKKAVQSSNKTDRVVTMDFLVLKYQATP